MDRPNCCRKMSPSISFYFLALIFFSQSSFSVATTPLEQLCSFLGDHYVTYEECISTLKTDPSSETADAQGLGVIAVNLTYANATAITSKLGELLKNDSKANPDKNLKACYQLYLDLVPSLRSAANSVASKLYESARAVLSVAMDVPVGCSGVLAITQENNAFSDLSNLALAIVKYLDKST